MARVLVVEDDHNYRTVMREVLEAEGFDVKEAKNGEEALLKYIAAPADVVILDLLMPRKSGLETIRDLHRGFPDARVIAISGAWQRQPGDLLHVADVIGADKTLAKPFKPEELVAAIREVLASPKEG